MSLRRRYEFWDTVLIHCEDCHHIGHVDYAHLARKIGWDSPSLAGNILPHYRCGRCVDAGRPGKNIGLRVHPDHRPPYDQKGPPEMWKHYPQSGAPDEA